MLAELIDILAPTFVCPVIGFIWARMGKPYAPDFVTRMAMSVAVPCLVFTTLAHVNLSFETFVNLALASAATLIATGLITYFVLRFYKVDQRAFWPAITFNNCGNLGLPICLFAFGEAGLALAIVFFTISSLSNFIFGVWVTSGTASPKGVLRTPLLYAAVAALIFLGLDIEPPKWLDNTTGLLGGMLIPMMLITLGYSLAGLKLASLPAPLAMSLMRLALGYGVGVATAWVFGLEGMARGVLIIQSAMPVAVFNYLFAVSYNRRASEVASTVLLSTLIGFILAPFLLASLI